MRKFPEIIKKRTENQLIKSFIEQFEKVISGSNYKSKRFSFVLTGGNSPKKLYKKLKKPKQKSFSKSLKHDKVN